VKFNVSISRIGEFEDASELIGSQIANVTNLKLGGLYA
jgi:hypothetical protein